MNDSLFELICAGSVLVLLVYYLRRRRKLRAVLWGATSGLAVLAALARYGAAIDMVPAVNPFTISVSAVLGIPGVVLVLLCGI